METIIFLAILIMSVVLHELAHGVVANALGDPTARLAGRLTLNPLAHLDPVGSFLVPLLLSLAGAPLFGWARPVPYNPYNLRAGVWGPALVGAAGPAANLAIALVFGLPLGVGVLAGDSPLALIFYAIVLVNVSLALFNLVPIPPLDGSKVLFALLPYRWREVERWMTNYQLLLVFFLVTYLWQFLAPAVFVVVRLITGA